MKRINCTVFVIVFFLATFIPLSTFAETIVFKTGRTIEAQIMERTANEILVKDHGAFAHYDFSEIESIDNQIIEKKEETKTSVPKKPAEDLSKNYYIFSSEYSENIMYMREDPPFRMLAPKGWYLAYLKEDVPGVDRALFTNYDPQEPLSQGVIDFPHIKIAFIPNPDPEELSSDFPAKNQMSMIEKGGGSIMVNEKITLDHHRGSHFTTTIPGSTLILDTYIFTVENTFVSIKLLCKTQAQFNELRQEVEEAIKSIKFNAVRSD